ncbi:serine hydrolase [Alteromonas sp. LMIT006]|uniref:serine hydrolase n=1 Tax=Alteromonadaceae TaxID=72275 RepID=UPI0020CA4C3B|nr:serine hydrolase [Alteromonas sp. LMIT006]UTP72686.1 serine hydrolase [Alteromonas sp. LMIT006]
MLGRWSIGLVSLGLLCGFAATAQEAKLSHNLATQITSIHPNPNPELITPDSLRRVVDKALQTFHTPGVAVGISHQGQIVHAQGYGHRDLANELPVNPFTYFRLASTSKAFTAASVAILVDEGKLAWDDHVIDHLPDFRLHDPYVTREFRIIDLLTHRSGLDDGAGDAMIWPEPSGFTRGEVIHNLRYLTPRFSFRQTYSYSNVLYITAAEIVAKVAQMPWAQFIDERIFQPLDMECYAGDMPLNALNNVAKGYGHNDERGIYPIPRNEIQGKELMSAAAGGLVCHVDGMLKWIEALLNDAKAPNGEMIFSSKALANMWRSHTLLNVSSTARNLHKTHFRAYGIGWRKENIYGYEMLSHTGTLSGYQAYVALIPEFELGVVVLNNGSNYGVRSSIMQSIIKSVMPEAPPMDWVDYYVERQAKAEARWLEQYGEKPEGRGKVNLAASAYFGEYQSEWYGTMRVFADEQNTIRLVSERMATLTGTLEPFADHSWVVRWDNQNAASDAFVHFVVNPKQEVMHFTLHPFQNKIEDDHNWRDMTFIKLVMNDTE